MKEKIIEGIMAVRDTGRVNMFDANTVQSIALELGYYELAEYISDNRSGYGHAILTGEVIV